MLTNVRYWFYSMETVLGTYLVLTIYKVNGTCSVNVGSILWSPWLLRLVFPTPKFKHTRFPLISHQ